MSNMKVTILTLFTKTCNCTYTADRGQDVRQECNKILLAKLNNEFFLNVLVDVILIHLLQILFQD